MRKWRNLLLPVDLDVPKNLVMHAPSYAVLKLATSAVKTFNLMAVRSLD
jgi:hypothetical protein